MFPNTLKASESLAQIFADDVEQEVRSLILQSGYFDPDWYLRQNAELAWCTDLLGHFLHRGGLETRSPSARFNVLYYLTRYPDVSLSGTNPLVHYLRFGRHENRIALSVQDGDDWILLSISPYFDAAWYVEQNPDVKNSDLHPLDHYLLFGGKEGRRPSMLFDPDSYLQANTDVRESGLIALVHYLRAGVHEHRMGIRPERR